MKETDFIPSEYQNFPETGKVEWRSPSNIALVKYWGGKKENQIPANPSISFTLNACHTQTSVPTADWIKKPVDFRSIFFLKENLKMISSLKSRLFFKRIVRYAPFIKQYHLTVESANSFPHSSGIASSASSMSALSLCLMEIEKQLTNDMSLDLFNRKASFLARLVLVVPVEVFKGNWYSGGNMNLLKEAVIYTE